MTRTALSRSPRPAVPTLLAAAAALLLATSCEPQRQRGPDWRLADTAKPALHAVHGDRLTLAMRALNDIALERLPPEMDLRSERDVRLRRIATAAAAIAQTAEDIPEALPNIELSQAEREVFLNLADKLHDQAVQLQEDATAGRYQQVEPAFDGLLATCNACHSAFRLPPL
jgi:hypothetical protein